MSEERDRRLSAAEQAVLFGDRERVRAGVKELAERVQARLQAGDAQDDICADEGLRLRADLEDLWWDTEEEWAAGDEEDQETGAASA